MTKPTVKTATAPRSLERPLGILLVIGGIIGLIGSFVLTYDEYQFLKNPQFRPSCDLNPVISCGSVMQSAQAKLFGFPNPWIGLAAFAALVTIGVVLLAGARFRRWFWLVLESGIVLGLIFAVWLLFQSVYRINALCPYCLAVDVAVITVFWYTTLYLVEAGHLRLKGRLAIAARFARRHHLDILLSVFLVIIAVILQHFWYYYGRYFH